jgi:hypothetical protein
VPIRSRILYLQRTPQALCYDRIGATLYFSALGVGSVSLLLPCVDLSWLKKNAVLLARLQLAVAIRG